MNQAERDALAEWETIKRLTGFPTVSPIGNPTMTLSLMGLAERLALALSASRPVGEVEIARIVEPLAFGDAADNRSFAGLRAQALTKARAILALTDGALASTANASTGDDIDQETSERLEQPAVTSGQPYTAATGSAAEEAPHSSFESGEAGWRERLPSVGDDVVEAMCRAYHDAGGVSEQKRGGWIKISWDELQPYQRAAYTGFMKAALAVLTGE